MSGVYLDNAATTAVDPRVISAMMPYLEDMYHNPSAAYTDASKVRNAYVRAASVCGELIGAAGDEIVFTSGGTESDNSALMGVFEKCLISGQSFHMITGLTEHDAVLNTCRRIEALGGSVTYIRPDSMGHTRPEDIEAAIRPDTRLVSVMTANNETGTINDISGIGEITSSRGILFHTDAVQAFSVLPIDVRAMHIDMLSASAHKLHGPKGVGLLYVRRGTAMSPFITGGGQQSGRRSGTENTSGVLGFAEAVRIASEHGYPAYVSELKALLLSRLKDSLTGVAVNGPSSSEPAHPGILNVSFEGIEGSSLLIELDMRGICASTGSACSAIGGKPSHVLTAMGLDGERIKGAMRFSLSRFTTREDTEYAAQVICERVSSMRRLLGR